MPRLCLSAVSCTLPGRASPFSLAGLLPAFCLGTPTPLLHNVALELADGERLALLGKWGSDKTSLLRLLNGQLTASAGTFSVEGTIVGIVDVEARLHPDSTGAENLARLAGDRLPEARALAAMDDLLDVPIRHCSPGMRYRVGFAALAACPGEVLLVDDCVRKADLAFRPMMLSHLKRLVEKARVAVIAEPLLLMQCNRFMELADGTLRSLESPARAAA